MSKGQFIPLHSGMTPPAALCAIVSKILQHLQSNVPGILENQDAEFIHQARVSLRRLRSAQKTFARILPDSAWQTITPEIKWLATLLGEARDLDVLLLEKLPAIESAVIDEPDFSPVAKALQQHRTNLQRKISTALTSKRYTLLLRNLQQWQNETGQNPPHSSDTLLEFAHRSLNKRRRQVNRLARQWRTLSPEQRHTLRKRIKKLRYSVAFFAPLYKPKPVKRYQRNLEQLQQLLGTINDAVTARALMAQLVKRDKALQYPAGFIGGWFACAEKNSMKQLKQGIHDLNAAAAFW